MAAATTAVLLFVAYEPFNVVGASLVCLVPFLWELERRVEGWPAAGGAAPPTGAKLGFWVGFIANGVLLSWMVIALWHFTPLSAAGYLASILVLGGWWAGLAWATVWVRRRTALPLWLVFPLLWTAMEWLIGHQLDVRFPWLGLGTSLTTVPVLVQWADVAGARGVTLWLAWVNVLAFLAVRRRSWRPVAAVAATVVVALGYGVWRERTTVLRPVSVVAVVQPNVGYEEKPLRREENASVLQLLDLTTRAESLPGVRMVAWPEAAIDNFFLNKPEWERWIADTARRTRIPILVGGLDARWRPDGQWDTWNAAFYFDTTGSDSTWPVYHKKYLVPIVERVPFLPPHWFGKLEYFGGFEHGDRFPVYPVAPHGALSGGGFGVLICYEDAFEDLPRLYRREGAAFLLNITNDAWFGRIVAPYQHASHLVMRAIETRMGVARAANTGISEFVNPLGRTYLATPLEVERVEADTVYTTRGRTPYVRLGDWVGMLSLVGSAALVAAAFLHRRSHGDAR